MELVLQFFVNGLLVGGVYALLALGIVMIFKATGIFNFAVGELMVVGGFLCWTFMMLGISPWLSIALTFLLSCLLGALIQQIGLRPLIGQPVLSAIMATLAIAFILRGLILIGWKGMVRNYPEFFPGSTVTLGPVTISHQLLWVFFLAIVIFGVVVLFFQRTRTGLQMRAIAEDHQLARVRGIPVGFVFIVTWAIAAMIAAAGGILLGDRLGISLPLADMGLKAFPAVLLGGLDSIPGAIVGGLIIGVAEALAGGLIDPAVGQIAPFIVLLLVLIFKTEGLFGLKRIERI